MEKYELKNINELRDLLGYKDIRAVRSWCKKNGLPIITVGKKEYLNQSMLDIILIKLFENSMIQSGIQESNANEMLTAILADQNQGLAGKSNQSNTNGHSFATKNDTPLKSLVQKYKTRIR